MASKPEEGMEKRGVIAYGWTPPPNSQVSVTKGRPFRDCAQTRDGNLDELDNDFTKKASQCASRKKAK